MNISPGPSDWVPDTCTLPTIEQPLRVSEFDDFFAEHVRGSHRPSPTRLDLSLPVDAERLALELADKESGCCSFFEFAFDTTATGTVMHIVVPPTQVLVLDALAARAASKIDRRAVE
ncbi:hypothetical protein [Nocardia salmonicida]|uniref:hypothetical protein n=1 Tax=Nocardia salmonicida TaxID=53431 RepID=UPI00340A71DF